MTADLADAPSVLLTSRVPVLRRVPLGDLREAQGAALSETLERVVPAPEASQVPVAAFNSSV